MIFESMKKLFTITFVLLTAVICLNAQAFAVVRKPPTVLVLTDSGHRNGTNYIICGAASDIIAEDIINELNKTKRIKSATSWRKYGKNHTKNSALVSPHVF